MRIHPRLYRARPTRRTALLMGTAAAASLARPAIGQTKPVRIGLMLPFSGTFAPLGENIAAAFEMYLVEAGGRLGGRAVQITRLDDESNPANAVQNVKRLLGRDGAQVLVGTVHSGVVLALAEAAREQRIPLIVPNAGNVTLSRTLCSPTVFRVSFSNWQPAYGMGKALAESGVKTAAYVTWDYAAGRESAEGFADGLKSGGAELVRVLSLPFPETNFQPLLAQLPGLNVQAVGAFFSGGGAVQFVRDYAAAGLKERLPLCGPGFLTEGTLAAQGAAAEGLRTALHYSSTIDTPRNLSFRKAFREKTGRDADVYAVQGYDAAQLLAIGLEAARGDLDREADMYGAMRSARIDSPRGTFALSRSQNPIQTIYLREVKNGDNIILGIAAKDLADPSTGCTLPG